MEWQRAKAWSSPLEWSSVDGNHFSFVVHRVKWIGSNAETLSQEQGYVLLFCYKELLGFCCGNVVYDEDGRFV